MAQRDKQEFLLERSVRFFATLFRRHFSPRKVRYALMSGLALSVAPFSGANAQQFSSIVAFGDSYADIGKIKDIMVANPPYDSYYLPSLLSGYKSNKFNWLQVGVS